MQQLKLGHICLETEAVRVNVRHTPGDDNVVFCQTANSQITDIAANLQLVRMPFRKVIRW